MSYTHNLTITVSPEQEMTAKRLSRVFDEDSGGFFAEFQPTYTSPIQDTFAPQVEYLMSDAAILQAAVAAKYAERFPELEAPTLAEVEAFLADVQWSLEPR